MDLHAQLFSDLNNINKAMYREVYCEVALIQTLKTVVENTRLEPEVLAIIQTCEKWMYKN